MKAGYQLWYHLLCFESFKSRNKSKTILILPLALKKFLSSLCHCLCLFSPHWQGTALSRYHRRCIKGQPGSSWPQRTTIVSCVTPPSVHWQLHRPTIRARTTPRSWDSPRPNRTPLTCRFSCRNVLHDKWPSVFGIVLKIKTSENLKVNIHNKNT